MMSHEGRGNIRNALFAKLSNIFSWRTWHQDDKGVHQAEMGPSNLGHEDAEMCFGEDLAFPFSWIGVISGTK
jgi:hypothetical protein